MSPYSQGVPNHPPNRLVFKPPFLGQKNLEWCYKKMASGKEITCFWRAVFVHDFCFLNKHCFYRVGVGVMLVMFFLCYGLDGHRDPQLLQTLESVGIAVGGCVLFHSVVLHCDSVVVRGFPLGFTAAPQIFGWIFFVFCDPQKRLEKNVLGPIRFGAWFFGCSTQCKPYFCSVLRVRNSIRFGSSGFSVFFGAVVFVFWRGEKSDLGVGKRMWQG